MATLPTQKLQNYYENYSTKEIAFNKSIRSVTGLDPQKVCLKISGEQWPCVLYSCSMGSAKIILSLDNAAFDCIKRARNIASLRFSFFPKTAKSAITFFVPATIKGYSVFKLQHGSSFLVSLEFSQRPPEDLIEVLGRIFESIESFDRRSELRINLDPKVVTDIGLSSANAFVMVDSIKRPCILKNLSASGGGIIMMCNPKFLVNKPTSLFMHVYDSTEPIQIDGNIVRYEELQGRSDMFLLGVLFDKEKISYAYKDIINTYIDKLEELMKYRRSN